MAGNKLNKLNDSLMEHDYAKYLKRSKTHNEVGDGAYIIDPTTVLPNFSTDFILAYNATAAGSNSPEFWAFAFKRSFPPRLDIMLTLLSNKVLNLIGPVAVEITTIGASTDEVLVAIVPRPKGYSLRQIKEKRRVDDGAILQIVRQLSIILNTLHALGIAHGSVNLDTVYLNEEGRVSLGECISSPCGFFQNAVFDCIEQSQAGVYGKSERNLASDFYALGMVAFALSSGRALTVDAATVGDKLHGGTFHYVNSIYLPSKKIAELVRGLVIDDPRVRWRHNQLIAAIDSMVNGTHIEMTPLKDEFILAKPIYFNDKGHQSKRALAHELITSPGPAKVNFLLQDKIIRWLDNAPNQHLVIENIDLLTNKKKVKKGGYIAQEEEMVLKVAMLLDPYSPFRFRNISFMPDALGKMIAHAMLSGQGQVIKILVNLLQFKILESYNYVYKIYGFEELPELTEHLDEIEDILEKTGAGFGLERLLYETNSALPCQSKLLKSKLCYSIEDIMEFLESYQDPVKSLVEDTHLISFLASKAKFVNLAKMSNIKFSSALEYNDTFRVLYILGVAQTKIGRNIPQFCGMLLPLIQEVIALIYRGQTIRKKVMEAIKKPMDQGSVIGIIDAISDADFINRDAIGFQAAKSRYQVYREELRRLEDKVRVEHAIQIRVYKTITALSYLTAVVVTSFLML
jgi:serine/threonine protein kinase